MSIYRRGNNNYEAKKWERGFKPTFNPRLRRVVKHDNTLLGSRPSAENRPDSGVFAENRSGMANITTLFEFIDYVNKLLNNPTYRQCALTPDSAKNIMEDLREFIQPLRINLTYEPLNILAIPLPSGALATENTTKRLRFMLSTNRYKADFSYPLVSQANGIIFELSGGAPIKCILLALPSHDFNPNPKYNEASESFSRNMYTVYHIRDGTTFNLYWDAFTNKWTMSTKNAVDISTLVWRGYTYDFIVSDVLAQYTDFSFDKLDKRITYVIGMKHPAHHPFKQPKEFTLINAASGVSYIKEAWLIQMNSLDSLESIDNVNIGIPIQQPVSGICNFYDLIRTNEVVLTDFLDNNSRLQENSVLYGFILRANNQQGKWKTNNPMRCDYILESTLWHAIRHMIYQMPFTPNRAIREKQEQNFKNMDYVIFDKFMNPEKREFFQHLFPQFNDKITAWNAHIEEAINIINIELKSKSSTTVPSTNMIATSIAARFLPIARDQYQTTQNKEIDVKIIRFIISNPKTYDILFAFLTVL
jgi:hypothetical protein